MLASQAHRDDLDPEGWTQVAIDHQGEMVGDLAVRAETSARRAALRYTIAPPAQHCGFATEAVAAMIDALFDRTEIRRIVATADDANPASMRVIEPLGFRFEGIALESCASPRRVGGRGPLDPPRGPRRMGVEATAAAGERGAGRTGPRELARLRRAGPGSPRSREEVRSLGAPTADDELGRRPRGSPEPFYRGLGFAPTGNMIDDEFEVALAL